MPGDTRRVQQLMEQTTCVLLVEDDELTRERLQSLIEAAGFGVFAVASAHDARMALQAVVFPLVVVDRMLPDGDGLDLCTEIRRMSAPNHVYAAILSARDSPEDVAAGLAAGADVYLSKRSSDTELLDHLRAAITSIALQVR